MQNSFYHSQWTLLIDSTPRETVFCLFPLNNDSLLSWWTSLKQGALVQQSQDRQDCNENGMTSVRFVDLSHKTLWWFWVTFQFSHVLLSPFFKFLFLHSSPLLRQPKGLQHKSHHSFYKLPAIHFFCFLPCSILVQHVIGWYKPRTTFTAISHEW